MKVRELKELLNSPHIERHLDDELSIMLSDPSMGPRAMVSVRHVGFGFDWEKGHCCITPVDNIVRLKEKEALWQAAHDFIYMLSQDVRYYKGVPKETELAKRAKSIIERSKERSK